MTDLEEHDIKFLKVLREVARRDDDEEKFLLYSEELERRGEYE